MAVALPAWALDIVLERIAAAEPHDPDRAHALPDTAFALRDSRVACRGRTSRGERAGRGGGPRIGSVIRDPFARVARTTCDHLRRTTSRERRQETLPGAILASGKGRIDVVFCHQVFRTRNETARRGNRRAVTYSLRRACQNL
ncbi:MAG TPA: hypothetical protein DDZ67_01585 [Xanthomonadaceae bacterium]|nr:hypothetical protein [Xanthomonadaceae bacterium]